MQEIEANCIGDEFKNKSNLLLMTITATWNIVVSSSPKSFIGISVGVSALMLFIGMAIGPALTGVYLESRESIAGIPGTYPNSGIV